MNIRLVIEYDGEGYHGWQRQAAPPTIQGALEDVISSVAGQKINVYGAGRTDSGVHAKGQVANFQTECRIPAERWCLMLNTKLPPSIRVLASEAVDEKFHAQKSARGKIYEYCLLNRNYASALDRRLYFWPHVLCWDKILKALPRFVGTKDFRPFNAGKVTVKTTVRTITRFEVIADPMFPGLYRFQVEGNGFLRRMVRTMVGTVMEIGQNVRDPESIDRLFLAGTREEAGRAVPARGLYLMKVIY
jgi:tRNA pseudouridine38-40 synthase